MRNEKEPASSLWKDMFTKSLDQRYQELSKIHKKIYDLITVIIFFVIIGSFILKQFEIL